MLKMNHRYACYMKNIAIRQCGNAEKYYEELHNLVSDIQFFEMYIQRNKKSNFNLTVSIEQPETFSLFEERRKVWGEHNVSEDTLETVYVECLCIQKLIHDLKDEKKDANSLTDDEELMLASYFEYESEVNLTDYVDMLTENHKDFSHVIEKIAKIRQNVSYEFS